ncbi:MAG: hypothetical protein LBE37_05640, partial [Sphingobacterium sp.]|nr:hypothetical protein [Sphingobacterium sp.]
MNIDRITYLVNRLHTGTISDVENNELLTWYRSVAYQDAEYPTEELKVKGRMLYRLLKDTGFVRQLETRRRRLKSIWYSAAACLLFSLFVLTLYIYSANDQDNGQLLVEESKVDYLPGGNKAQLILEDGSKINLDRDKSSLIIGDGITYTDGSSLASKIPENKPSGRLQLVTPR